jgi:hypothetical protein
MAANEPVQEALDHLLDPLGVPAVNSEDVWDEAADEAETIRVSRSSSRGDVAEFFFRLRWSGRLLYKIPRLLIAWTALIAGICGLIWIAFGITGLR